MDTKLTLKLNREVIERAKRYAQEHNQSLSRLVERLLNGVTVGHEAAPSSSITPRVKRLAGAMLPLGNIDEKDVIGEYLQEKYQ